MRKYAYRSIFDLIKAEFDDSDDIAGFRTELIDNFTILDDTFDGNLSFSPEDGITSGYAQIKGETTISNSQVLEHAVDNFNGFIDENKDYLFDDSTILENVKNIFWNKLPAEADIEYPSDFRPYQMTKIEDMINISVQDLISAQDIQIKLSNAQSTGSEVYLQFEFFIKL